MQIYKKKQKASLISASILALTPLSSLSAAAFVIDFNTDDAGNTLTSNDQTQTVYNVETDQPYSDLFGAGSGVSLTSGSATNPLNIYNSNGTFGLNNTTNGQGDPDLERQNGWEGGNTLNNNADFGNLLIINDDSNLGIPDDEGSGGTIILDFDIALSSFGFDFVDLDAGAAVSNSTITFFDSLSNNSIAIGFNDLESNGFFGDDALFGNRNANNIDAISATQLSNYSSTNGDGTTITQFDQVTFNLNGSGGIGALTFDTVPNVNVPEPSGALLLSLGGMALILRRRK